MAPVAVEEDYYLVLKVLESDSVEVITKAYKRLALHLHPDRNKSQNATEAFQTLSKAYETLKDENTRRIYDTQHYPRIKKAQAKSSQARPKADSNEPGDSKSQDKATSIYVAEISTILKAKEDRATKWSKTKTIYDNEIFELNREIQKLWNSIRNFETIEKMEAVEAAVASSWTTWIMSAIITKPVETEEEKKNKKREKLQRLHARGINEILLQHKETELRVRESLLADKAKEFEAANMQDDMKKHRYEEMIWGIQTRVREAKERAAREERERNLREQQAKWRKEAQERREREEKEAAEQEKRAAAEWTALQEKLAKESAKRRQRQEKYNSEHDIGGRSATGASIFGSTPHPTKPNCSHDGWWPKLEGTQLKRSCEKCGVSRYTYLLECPSCHMLACASCQHTLRPRRRNTNRGSNFRARQKYSQTFSENCEDFAWD